MIKGIYFDLGGVLFTNGTKKFCETISSRYSIEKEIVTDVIDGEIGSSYREGKISREEFWNYFLERLHIANSPDKLEEEWIRLYELIEGTKDIVLELSKTYPMYYLSDNVRERVNKLDERFGFLKWFKDGIFSHDVGVRKPHPRIYTLAVHKAGVLPEEILFIDDKRSSLVPAEQ